MQASDSNLKEVLDICKSKLENLLTKNFTIPSNLPEDELFPQEFSQEYKRRFPNSVLFSELDVTFQIPKNYNPDNLYYSSRISYVQLEDRTCSGTLYSKPKNNTYTLCPICKPFSDKGNKPHMEKRQGRTYEFDISEPRFYDTLHSQFDHHMNHVHGIFKDGTTVVQPMLVLAEDDHRKFELNSLCPMVAKDKKHACLWMNKVNLKAIENPLKAYLRHYTAAHARKGSVVKEKDTYNAKKFGHVYPIEMNDFLKTFNELKQQCIEVPKVLFKELPDDPGLTFHQNDETTVEDLDDSNIDAQVIQHVALFNHQFNSFNEVTPTDLRTHDIEHQFEVVQYNSSHSNPLSEPAEYQPETAPSLHSSDIANIESYIEEGNSSQQIESGGPFGIQPMPGTIDPSVLKVSVPESTSTDYGIPLDTEIETASDAETQQNSVVLATDIVLYARSYGL